MTSSRQKQCPFHCPLSKSQIMPEESLKSLLLHPTCKWLVENAAFLSAWYPSVALQKNIIIIIPYKSAPFIQVFKFICKKLSTVASHNSFNFLCVCGYFPIYLLFIYFDISSILVFILYV